LGRGPGRLPLHPFPAEPVRNTTTSTTRRPPTDRCPTPGPARPSPPQDLPAPSGSEHPSGRASADGPEPASGPGPADGRGPAGCVRAPSPGAAPGPRDQARGVRDTGRAPFAPPDPPAGDLAGDPQRRAKARAEGRPRGSGPAPCARRRQPHRGRPRPRSHQEVDHGWGWDTGPRRGAPAPVDDLRPSSRRRRPGSQRLRRRLSVRWYRIPQGSTRPGAARPQQAEALSRRSPHGRKSSYRTAAFEPRGIRRAVRGWNPLRFTGKASAVDSN
ncbi:MAG: hypothetical protein QG608_1547, partial [Actinomycetota bacterium]|nr:hypothetical protein [Actinomycetota bacterium]